ncbi:porin family protein [Pontibacter silvestris]|uniref:Porin family protein n=1 Tax=Pontibacter silvestris TaxID=2305183 RepID=A0ABW4WYA6_9BACT|nr:porin family protein [Pontibacter silvestris]MCC9136846.1 PorT family protein [Pontibacter silvestris]
MKKILLILTMMLTTGLVANAQFFTAGVKAGVSSSSVDIKDPIGTVTQFKESENIAGYQVGAFTRFKVGNLLLQPEAAFTYTGGKVEVNDDPNTTSVEVQKFKFNRLDVPILLGYSLFRVVRVSAGPVASMVISGKLDDDKIDEYLNNSDWGWQAGLGVDIGNITADVRYERIKRNYTDNVDTGYDITNEQVILSVGLKLFGKN